MKRLKTYFLTGFVSSLPLIITLYLFSGIWDFLLTKIEKTIPVSTIVEYLVKNYFKEDYVAKLVVKWSVYFTVLVILFFIIVLVGATLRNVVGHKIAKYFDSIFFKIPIIKQVYATLKQISDMILSGSSKAYQKVVLIEYPRKGIYSLGFLTNYKNEYFENISGEERLVNVFIPTSPNPTSGMFIMMSNREVIELDLKVDEAVKLIISGGAIVPNNLKKK
jgi:uncharacterized membrane protein